MQRTFFSPVGIKVLPKTTTSIQVKSRSQADSRTSLRSCGVMHLPAVVNQRAGPYGSLLKIRRYYSRMTLLSTILSDAERLAGRRPNLLTITRMAVTSTPFRCVLMYRASATAYRLSPPLGRMLYQANLFLHGADIDPRSTIGQGLLLQHPVGVVIGGGASLGQNCTVMGGVVLGRREVLGGPSPLQYPQVGSGVLLGAGACALGRVEIGDDSVVGALTLVLRDVPSGSVAVGNPATIRTRQPESQ